MAKKKVNVRKMLSEMGIRQVIDGKMIPATTKEVLEQLNIKTI